MFAIIQTKNGKIPDRTDDHCYLDKSCLSSMSFGSPEMMWTCDDLDQAINMLNRISDKNPTKCEIIEL